MSGLSEKQVRDLLHRLDAIYNEISRVKETLARVIHDGETVTINGDDGKPAAIIMPYTEYQEMKR